MRTTISQVVIAGSLSACVLWNAHGQDARIKHEEAAALGLTKPDFLTIRTLFRDPQSLSLPEGKDTGTIRKHWNSISMEGRELLLDEADLAVVVVKSDGGWAYRSSRVHRLRFLAVKSPRFEDHADLDTIVHTDWFRIVRDFHRQDLFARHTPAFGRQLGKSLAYASTLDGASAKQKKWFSSLVGYHMATLDASQKAALVTDPTCRHYYVQAIAAADASKGEQLENIRKTLVAGHPSHQTVTFRNLRTAFPLHDHNLIPISTITPRSLAGKPIIEWSAKGNTIWLAPSPGTELVKDTYSDPDKLQELIKQGKIAAFYGRSGDADVRSVKVHVSQDKP